MTVVYKYSQLFTERALAVQSTRWCKIGLSTEPTDWDGVTEGLELVYGEANFKPPTNIIKLDSPLQGAIAASLIVDVSKQVWNQVSAQVRNQVSDQVSDQVKNQVWDQVSAQVSAQVGSQVSVQVWGHVWGQVRKQVSDQVRAQASDQVRDQVRDQVWKQVSAQVRDQVGDQVRNQVRKQVSAQVWEQAWEQVWSQVCYGAHDAYWLAYYSIFDKVEETKRLRGLIKMAESTGWYWPFEDTVIITERPSEILWKDGEVVHIEYPDNWSVSKVGILDLIVMKTFKSELSL